MPPKNKDVLGLGFKMEKPKWVSHCINGGIPCLSPSVCRLQPLLLHATASHIQTISMYTSPLIGAAKNAIRKGNLPRHVRKSSLLIFSSPSTSNVLNSLSICQSLHFQMTMASLMATQRYTFVAEEQRRLTPSSDGSSMLNRRTSASCPLEMSDVSGFLHFSKAVSQAPWNNGCFLRCAHPTKNCTHDTPRAFSDDETHGTSALQNYSCCCR